MSAIKQDGGWLYKDVFIAKQKNGFSFTVVSATSNPKGANWHRPVPSSLKSMISEIDLMLSNGATVSNRKVVKAVA